MPAASNSGATSPIAAHCPTRADRCSRQPSAPRAHAGRADISSRNCLTKARGLFSTSLPEVVMLSALKDKLNVGYLLL